MDDQWARHKAIIKQYWIVENMKLEQVADIMRENHGFNKKPKTYETKFRKWGVEFSKNQKASLWKAVGAKVRKREEEGKKTNVCVQGSLIPERKLRKEIARYSYQSTFDKYCPVLSPKTTNEFTICTPRSLPDLSYIWNDLPWLRFQNAVQSIANTGAGPSFGTITTNMNIWADIPTRVEYLARSRAIMPPSNYGSEDSSLEIHGTGAKTQLYFSNILIYLVSNNLMGCFYEPFWNLEDNPYRSLLLSFVRMKTNTTRVLVQKLCKFAIKNKKTEFLDMLDPDILLDAWGNNFGHLVVIAIHYGQKSLATRLVQAGADLSGESGAQVLISATGAGYHEMVQILIDQGIDINARPSEYGLTALMVAISNGDDHLVQILIKSGADFNLKSNNRNLWLKKVLEQAIERGDTRLVRFLVDAGAEINEHQIRTPFSTPLQSASRNGDKRLVKLLLDHNAIVNAPALVKGGLLRTAVEGGHFEIASILIQAGAAVNPPLLEDSGSGRKAHSTVLNEAVERGDVELVQLLLEHGADPNIPSYVTLAWILWQHGTGWRTPNDADLYRQTDLCTAVCQGSVQIVQLLIRAGAQVNDISESYSRTGEKREETALHAAVQLSNFQLVDILLQAHADVSIPATRSRHWYTYHMSTWEIAAENPSGDITRLLLAADPTMTANSKAYALQIAVDLCDLCLVRLLLETGANVNTRPPRTDGGTPLQRAVHKGNRQIVELLLDTGATVNAPGTWRRGTALQEAVGIGDMHLIKLLLAAGADINAPGAGLHGRTVLQNAVKQGRADLVRFFLRAGADVNDNNSGKPLRMAAKRCNIEVVELLLRFNAVADPPSTQGRTYLTALQGAAEAGSVSIVTLLLEKGADIDAGINDWRGTALQGAARKGHTQVVEILLDKGANINAASGVSSYGTALHEAIKSNHHELVYLLLSRHANPNIPGSMSTEEDDFLLQGTALTSAIEKGSLDLARLLVEAGARADILTAEDQERRTPLEAAMDTDDDDMVQLVLEAGANVNLPGRYLLGSPYPGDWVETALIAAVSRKDVRKVQLILDAQADVNTPSEFAPTGSRLNGHITPLQAAVLASNSDIVGLLLDAGADAKISTHFAYYLSRNDRSPLSGSLLEVAVRRRYNKIVVDRLVQCGAAVNILAKGKFGRTSLQAAVEIGDIELVEQFIRLGADVNAPPSEDAGATALQLAAIHGYAGIVSVLLDAGADPHAEGAKIEGRTALEGAAEQGRIDLVQLLLNAGDAIHLPVQKYANALRLAEAGEYYVIVDMIKTAITNADNA